MFCLCFDQVEELIIQSESPNQDYSQDHEHGTDRSLVVRLQFTIV